MEKSEFVYVTYIRTAPEKLWQALTDPEFTRRYWMEMTQDCDWNKGSSWRAKAPAGGLLASGEIVEADPPRKLVLTWRSENKPELQAEGHSQLTYEIEKRGSSVKLTVIHQMAKPGSKLIQAVGGGWPIILASLKSFLETGEPLEETKQYRPC